MLESTQGNICEYNNSKYDLEALQFLRNFEYFNYIN